MPPSLDVLARAAAVTLRISLPTILEAGLGTLTRETCDERLDFWSKHLVDQAGINIQVAGREHIARGEPYLVMSNHQSHYDIPVLFQALRIPMRMVAKKEIFRIPFMSGAMRAAGFIEIDRGNRVSAIESLREGRARLGEVSLWIAPEGTRSKTGELGQFKKGGFRLAVDSGLPILPVTIDGTRFVLPSGGLSVKRGVTAHVTISRPIDAAAYGKARLTELVADVRSAIASKLRT